MQAAATNPFNYKPYYEMSTGIIPNGEYLMKLHSLEDKVSNNGNRMYVATFRMLDPEYEGKILDGNTYILLPPHPNHYLYEMLARVHGIEPVEGYTIDLYEPAWFLQKGVEFTGSVELNSYRGRKSMAVRRIQ